MAAGSSGRGTLSFHHMEDGKRNGPCRRRRNLGATKFVAALTTLTTREETPSVFRNTACRCFRWLLKQRCRRSELRRTLRFPQRIFTARQTLVRKSTGKRPGHQQPSTRPTKMALPKDDSTLTPKSGRRLIPTAKTRKQSKATRSSTRTAWRRSRANRHSKTIPLSSGQTSPGGQM